MDHFYNFLTNENGQRRQSFTLMITSFLQELRQLDNRKKVQYSVGLVFLYFFFFQLLAIISFFGSVTFNSFLLFSALKFNFPHHMESVQCSLLDVLKYCFYRAREVLYRYLGRSRPNRNPSTPQTPNLGPLHKQSSSSPNNHTNDSGPKNGGDSRADESDLMDIKDE